MGKRSSHYDENSVTPLPGFGTEHSISPINREGKKLGSVLMKSLEKEVDDEDRKIDKKRPSQAVPNIL